MTPIDLFIVALAIASIVYLWYGKRRLELKNRLAVSDITMMAKIMNDVGGQLKDAEGPEAAVAIAMMHTCYCDTCHRYYPPSEVKIEYGPADPDNICVSCFARKTNSDRQKIIEDSWDISRGLP